MGFFSVLGLILIILKLVGTITFSWWLVLLPLYGPLLICIVILAIAAIRMYLTC